MRQERISAVLVVYPGVDSAVLEDLGVVDDSVDHGSGHGDKAEKINLLGKGQVGSVDDGAVFVASGDELEE